MKKLLLVLVLAVGVLFSSCDKGEVLSSLSVAKSHTIKNVSISEVTPASESDIWMPKKAYKLLSLISDAEIGSKYFSTVGEYYGYCYIMADGYLTDWSLTNQNDIYSITVVGYKENGMKLYAMRVSASLKQDGNDIKATVLSHDFLEDLVEVSDEKMVEKLKMSGLYNGKSVSNTPEISHTKEIGFSHKEYDPEEAGSMQIEDLNYDIFVRDYVEKYGSNNMVKGTKKQRALVNQIGPYFDFVSIDGNGHTVLDLFNYLDGEGIEYDAFIAYSIAGDDTATLYIYITKNNVNKLSTIFIDFDVYTMGRNLGTEFDISNVIVWDKAKNDYRENLDKILFDYYGR